MASPMEHESHGAHQTKKATASGRGPARGGARPRVESGKAWHRRPSPPIAPMTAPIARLFAALTGIGCAVALCACAHPTPDRSAAGDDDPWVTRGSVGAGPVYGTPKGPYSPR